MNSLDFGGSVHYHLLSDLCKPHHMLEEEGEEEEVEERRGERGVSPTGDPPLYC